MNPEEEKVEGAEVVAETLSGVTGEPEEEERTLDEAETIEDGEYAE